MYFFNLLQEEICNHTSGAKLSLISWQMYSEEAVNPVKSINTTFDLIVGVDCLSSSIIHFLCLSHEK